MHTGAEECEPAASRRPAIESSLLSTGGTASPAEPGCGYDERVAVSSPQKQTTLLIQPRQAVECLDRVQHLVDLNQLDPAHFVHALRADLGPPAALEVTDGVALLSHAAAQLDALHQVLLAIEPFARKIMGIRLTHALATEPAPPQLRALLSATILSYAGDLRLLARRFERSLSVTALDAIVAAAEAVLALRHELQQEVFAIGQALAAAYLPRIAKAARSPLLSDAQQARMRQACVDLQNIAQSPLVLLHSPFEARIKALPVPDADALPAAEEEAAAGTKAPVGEHGRFALLEID